MDKVALASLPELVVAVKKEEVNIFDLVLVEIVREELTLLEQGFDLDQVSKFVLELATLLEIKSRLLLPFSPPAQEEEDSGFYQRLVQDFIESREVRKISEILENRSQEGGFYIRGNLPQIDAEYSLEVSLFDLYQVFKKVIEEKERPVFEIIQEEVTLELKVADILKRLKRRKYFDFEELFSAQTSRLGLIVTFLALLELIKESKILIRQSNLFGNIRVFRRENVRVDG